MNEFRSVDQHFLTHKEGDLHTSSNTLSHTETGDVYSFPAQYTLVSMSSPCTKGESHKRVAGGIFPWAA